MSQGMIPSLSRGVGEGPVQPVQRGEPVVVDASSAQRYREPIMRIILVRHGETEENAAGIIQGHLPGTLSARGREQAYLLGVHLRDHEITHVYSSDLTRARDTAAEIIRRHPGVPVTYLTGLRERYLGSWQGKRGTDVDRSIILASPGIETDTEIAERAEAVVRRVQQESEGGSAVVLVAHGGVNYAIIGALVGEERRAQMEFMQNAAISVFESASGDGVEVISHNEATHLKEIE